MREVMSPRPILCGSKCVPCPVGPLQERTRDPGKGAGIWRGSRAAGGPGASLRQGHLAHDLRVSSMPGPVTARRPPLPRRLGRWGLWPPPPAWRGRHVLPEAVGRGSAVRLEPHACFPVLQKTLDAWTRSHTRGARNSKGLRDTRGARTAWAPQPVCRPTLGPGACLRCLISLSIGARIEGAPRGNGST